MKEVVYESENVDQFETNWGNFITHFGLINNQWLTSLYEERHQLIPIYLEGHFWARLLTTQRSDSMNASLTVKFYDNTQQFVQ